MQFYYLFICILCLSLIPSAVHETHCHLARGGTDVESIKRKFGVPDEKLRAFKCPTSLKEYRQNHWILGCRFIACVEKLNQTSNQVSFFSLFCSFGISLSLIPSSLRNRKKTMQNTIYMCVYCMCIYIYIYKLTKNKLLALLQISSLMIGTLLMCSLLKVLMTNHAIICTFGLCAKVRLTLVKNPRDSIVLYSMRVEMNAMYLDVSS